MVSALPRKAGVIRRQVLEHDHRGLEIRGQALQDYGQGVQAAGRTHHGDDRDIRPRTIPSDRSCR
jgi:hypothetical protein